MAAVEGVEGICPNPAPVLLVFPGGTILNVSLIIWSKWGREICRSVYF